MSALTVSQLQEILGTGEYNYVAPSGDFLSALRQVLPRIYALGLWRDLAYETSMTGKYGYVSLPADTDAVLACTINNVPRPTRSMWQDIRITGRQAVLSTYYGIVDDGFSPVLLDMTDVQEVATEDDVVAVASLQLVEPGTATAVSDFTGDVQVKTDATNSGKTQRTTADLDGLIVPSDTFARILGIVYNNVESAVDLIDPNFPDQIIASIPEGSGVVRFRRFRISQKGTNTVVHLLVKRACPSVLNADTVVHLGNIGAIKHGLLGLIAEDNADLDRSKFHWGAALALLDQDLLSITGSAQPTLRYVDPASAPITNLM